MFRPETEAKGTSDRLSEEWLSAMVNKPELVMMTERHRPSGAWAFWYPESEMDKTELEAGQEVRLKTRGNSPFICESLLLSCFWVEFPFLVALSLLNWSLLHLLNPMNRVQWGNLSCLRPSFLCKVIEIQPGICCSDLCLELRGCLHSLNSLIQSFDIQ